jgi:archaellum component FlaC
MEVTTQMMISFLVLLGGGVGVWVAMNNKVTRLETKIEMIEKSHDELKSSFEKGFAQLRQDFMTQFQMLREDIHKLTKQ